MLITSSASANAIPLLLTGSNIITDYRGRYEIMTYFILSCSAGESS